MLYMHYCHHCQYIHMLNGHKSICPACGKPLSQMDISYLDYSRLSLEERETLLHRLAQTDSRSMSDYNSLTTLC